MYSILNVVSPNIRTDRKSPFFLNKRPFGLGSPPESTDRKKPCVCIQCGARFSFRNQLTEHKHAAHNDTTS